MQFFHHHHYNIYNLYKKEWDEKLIKLTKLAKEKLNCSLTTLAIAWVIANPDVSTVLLGASKVSQLEETIKAVEVSKKITKEDFLEIAISSALYKDMEIEEFKYMQLCKK